MKLADKSHPITVTSKNIGESLILNILDHEFYWEEKCKDHKNLKKHGHGGSYKQAYVETHIKKLLESQKDEARGGSSLRSMWAWSMKDPFSE